MEGLGFLVSGFRVQGRKVRCRVILWFRGSGLLSLLRFGNLGLATHFPA